MFMGSGQILNLSCNGLTPLPSISPGRRSPYPLKGSLSRREHLQTTNSYCRYPVVFWYSSLVTGKATSKMRCGAYVGRSKTRRNPTKTGHPLQYQNLPRRLDHVLPIWIRRLGTERGVVTPCTTHLSFKTCASHYPKSSFCFCLLIIIISPSPSPTAKSEGCTWQAWICWQPSVSPLT